jgi:NAD(P)-dependent dehydrogenase (short-subunit alcohol dehydrogenase family)
MSGQLSGRRALVTGAAGGIGGAIAAEFIAQGADVIGVDRVDGGSAPIVIADLGDAAALEVIVTEATARLGGVDLLVNVAGVSIPESVQDLTRENYDRTLAINLHAPVFLMSRLGSEMAARGYGRIVNITSVHGRLSEPLSLAYDVSKGGLEAATRTVAIELAPAGVIVNAIAPGFVNTAMSIVDGVNELDSEWFQSIYVRNARLPIQRAAEPREIATHVAFLCSEANTYLTGQTIQVDGGLSSRF